MQKTGGSIFGGMEPAGNIFLAPVAGFTDKVFRGICIAHGADFTFTELVSSEALVRGGSKTLVLLQRALNETRFGIQLFGANPEVMAAAASIAASYSPSVIDINAGCPVPKVVKRGAGAALMRTPLLLGKMTAAMVKAASPVPVSVKLRSGWDAQSLNYAECGKIAAESGAAFVTLHPRTRAQGYGGFSDWPSITRLAAGLDIPVCGSGDLFTAEDALRMLGETGCAAVMFARGALGNPFIFDEARALQKGGHWTPPSPEERIKTALSHLRALAAEIGEETACRAIRAHFCRYFKGLSRAAQIRGKVVQALTIADYEAAVFDKPAVSE
jgi:nifR3 family TIM-barrel protein